MVWPTGWKMIVIILKPEFLKRGHFISKIHVSQRCDYWIIQNIIITFKLQFLVFFAICSQFINFVHRVATWRDLIWFTIFILKSNFYKFMLWKLTYRVWKYQKFLNLGIGHSPLPKPHPTPNGRINIVAGPLFNTLRRLCPRTNRALARPNANVQQRKVRIRVELRNDDVASVPVMGPKFVKFFHIVYSISLRTIVYLSLT